MKFTNVHRRAEAEQSLFSQSISDADYAQMVAANRNADVIVHFLRPCPNSTSPPPVTVRRQDAEVTLVLRLYPGWVDLSTIVIETPGEGRGRRLLSDVFLVLREFGFGQVRCVGKNAARTDSSRGAFGYYAMPRFGFDGDLPVAVRQRLPTQLAHHRTICELLETTEGRRYWKKNGVTLFSLDFDLAENSDSWQRLRSS